MKTKNSNLLIITQENFSKEVVESDKPILIDFWAEWCAPCKMIAPTIEEIANEATDYNVGKINIDDQPELAAKFKVMSIPTLMVIKSGKVLKTSVGAQPKNTILSMLK